MYRLLRRGMRNDRSIEPNVGAIAGWLITAWFVWVVLLLSSFISLAIVFSLEQEPWDWGGPNVPMVAVCAVLATVFASLSYAVPSLLFRRRRCRFIKSLGAYYLVQFMLAMFFTEMVAILGQVCAFTGLPSSIVAFVFFGVTWALLIYHFPTRRKITRWVDEAPGVTTSRSAQAQRSSAHEMSARDALRRLLSVIRSHWKSLVGVSGAWYLPYALFYFWWVETLSRLDDPGPMASNLITFVSIPFYAGAHGGVVLVATGALTGRGAHVGAAIAASWRRLVPLVATSALVWVGTWLGLMLLVVPGVLLQIRWSVAIPALMAGERGPIASLEASWSLTRPHQLAILYALLAVFAASTVLVFAVSWPWLDFSALDAVNPYHGRTSSSNALDSVLTWCATTSTTVLFGGLSSVFYAALRPSTVEERIEQPRVDAERL